MAGTYRQGRPQYTPPTVDGTRLVVFNPGDLRIRASLAFDGGRWLVSVQGWAYALLSCPPSLSGPGPRLNQFAAPTPLGWSHHCIKRCSWRGVGTPRRGLATRRRALQGADVPYGRGWRRFRADRQKAGSTVLVPARLLSA